MPNGVPPISTDEIQSHIVEALPDAQVHIRDYTGGGDHYEAVVVSSEFDGKNAVHDIIKKASNVFHRSCP